MRMLQRLVRLHLSFLVDSIFWLILHNLLFWHLAKVYLFCLCPVLQFLWLPLCLKKDENSVKSSHCRKMSVKKQKKFREITFCVNSKNRKMLIFLWNQFYCYRFYVKSKYFRRALLWKLSSKLISRKIFSWIQVTLSKTEIYSQLICQKFREIHPTFFVWFHEIFPFLVLLCFY